MLTISEFARFAQVSSDLLHYYDRIDLFKPVYINSQSSYRYYHIEQLSEFNRIMALKDLGFTLQQIDNLVHDNISTSELRNMLILQKSQAEQNLRAELSRIRRIETRLQNLDVEGVALPYDISTKTIPVQTYLSANHQHYSQLTNIEFFYTIVNAMPKEAVSSLAVMHDMQMNWDMGFVVPTETSLDLPFTHQIELYYQDLPAYELVATTVYTGSWEGLHMPYSNLGRWLTQNGYKLAGPTREVFYHVDADPGLTGHVVEIQMPITL